MQEWDNLNQIMDDMIGPRVAQAFFRDAAARNADGGDAQSATDIRFLHAIADDEGIGGEIIAFYHELGETFFFAGAVQDRCAVAGIGGEMRKVVADFEAFQMVFDFRDEIITQDDAGDILRRKPVQKCAGAAPRAGLGGFAVIVFMKNVIRFVLGGEHAVDIAAIAFIKMDDREIEGVTLLLQGNRSAPV